VELHVHLDGSFDPDVLWKYISSENPDVISCLPTESPLPWNADLPDQPQTLNVKHLISSCTSRRDFHQLCTCRGYRSLAQMLTRFEMFLPIVRLGKLELIEKVSHRLRSCTWSQIS
jgi:hypothetical protein